MMAFLLAVLALAAAPSNPFLAFDPSSRTVQLFLGGRQVDLLGPIEVAFANAPDAQPTYRGTLGNSHFYRTGPCAWRIEIHRRGADLGLLITSRAPAARVVPGKLRQAPWLCLNLTQYALAHGQPTWPKTFFLPKLELFVTCWFDWSASAASIASWPPGVADALRGADSIQPAPDMVYLRPAPARELLWIRASPRLWRAVLPATHPPSEYRHELARMAYLDIWGAPVPGRAARQWIWLLRRLRALLPPELRLLTIIQSWQAGGFDALLPGSIWMPDYPPSPAVGTVADLARLCALAKSLGRCGFRTNYMLLRPNAPSRLRGLVDFAVGPDGGRKWHTQPARWLALARRQEREIARLLRPNASFTDQLASGAAPWAWLDFNPSRPTDSISAALARQRRLARFIKHVHAGPLGSETLNQQDLIGFYVDFGDFGVLDGHNRFFTPEYKLRRLHLLTALHGQGLPYRFFELPPYRRFHSGQADHFSRPELMDDYRCCEVLCGNGAYIFWPGPTWSCILSELFTVGLAQRYWLLQPVRSVEYWHAGRWLTLEQLIRAGFVPEIRPWRQKQETFARARIRYANGLWVYINRLADSLKVHTPAGTIILPQYSWLCYFPDGSLIAYSALYPGTSHRVDFLDDCRAGLRFINPRGAQILGSSDVRLWRRGELVWTVDLCRDTAYLRGGRRPSLRPPLGPPLIWADFDFTQGLCGWSPAAGILQARLSPSGLVLHTCTPDPQLYSPPLSIPGRAGDAIVLEMASTAGQFGQLYFATAADSAYSERQVLRFPVQPDNQLHTIAIPVGNHPRWPGHTITGLRLDPIHGPREALVTLRRLRLVRRR